MKCAVHSEADATGFCRNCGKPMCAVCVRPVRDVLYCEDCLAKIVGIPGQPVGSVPGGPVLGAPAPAVVSAPVVPLVGPSSILAFFLGFPLDVEAFYTNEH